MRCGNYADPVLLRQGKDLRNPYFGKGFKLMFGSRRQTGKIKGMETTFIKCV